MRITDARLIIHGDALIRKSEGRGKCQLKESKPFDDSIKAYIESWDCPIAIKEDGDDADHT